MRPLRLEVKGFTAFREPVEIDFGELDVFAISGPTGSGKSSLLDAMTYALFGRVERVGDGVKQLVSQGLPRMVVMLEFEVGHDRYRVTRSTPSGRGATKILLERRDPDGEWRQAGDGADRVRDTDAMLRELIGLTYDGFTRSVLLPQGKFAEFLVGEAKKRRDILTELLGLSLFRRLAERANAVSREAAVRAQERTLSMDREYADATPAALKAATASAEAAEARERDLGDAAEAVLESLGRWKDSARTGEELQGVRAEVADVLLGVRAATDDLGEVTAAIENADEAVAAALAAHAGAASRLEAAEAALRQADAVLGEPSALNEARLVAHSMSADVEGRGRAAAGLDELAGQAEALGVAHTEAVAAAETARATLLARQGDAAKAEAAVEEARHADLVAAVTLGAKAGDPCPVCGARMDHAPKRPAAGGLERATAHLGTARAGVDAAATAVAEAERAVDLAAREVQANEERRKAKVREITDLDHALAEARSRLSAVLGDPLPDDPAAEIDRRAEERQRVLDVERAASREAAGAAQALLKAEHERDRLAGLIERHRQRLTADLGPLFERGARAMGSSAPTPRPPAAPGDAEPASLVAFGTAVAEALTGFAELLDRELEDRSSLEARLLAEAVERVGDLVEPADTLEGLAHAVNAACRAATAAVATTAKEVQDLATRLERKRELAKDIQEQEDRARRFRALAQELRADRLIAFLQAEALQVLAAAGSDRLAELSDGRYRLVCREDEFLVVDTWNGDEERSVRTLSGGETFLASLALALALADQVRSLSVTDRARLDSLFLDEGFGTLDPETLRTVTDAIEVLAGDGRLVGVITHVRELAEQFPRIEVRKDRVGSRLELVS